ncbi:hypothetical protein [Bartonella taylorii]|uniref:hypothetical protein n=1 Tax=Bartonella taylorii TaxID=33046 RepID=UPI001FEF619D|nr:hypothetical protein [Bartonella taylorii]
MFCRGQAGYRSAAESVMKQLLSLGMPLAVGFISQMIISFTDAAFVAHLGV